MSRPEQVFPRIMSSRFLAKWQELRFSYTLTMRISYLLLLPLLCSACSVIAVADAAVTVAATTVKVGATVVETAVDVTAAGVKAVVGKDEPKK